jgi:dihydrofolate reductase
MINKAKIEEFVRLALKHLHGKWVIIGGSALYFLGLNERVIVDVDLAKFSNDYQNLKLFKIAEEMGLEDDAISRSRRYFLEKIPEWQENLIEIAANETCQILRPNANLFILLKAQG